RRVQMYTRKTRRTLKDQTIKDSFMFEAVMTDGDNCKELLEMVLGRRLTEISVSKEHSIDNNPDYKASRLDIFASDEEGTRYNIEMQVATEHTELRSRYYHSQMDMDILLAGTDYEYLPESYVIFICDYDPLGYNKYIYTMNTHCEELPELKYRDGVHTIFLSTKGNNTTEVPEEIIKFLRYVSAGLKESEQDFGSDFVTKLQRSVKWIKRSRSKEREYMVLDEIKKKERREGLEEGIEIGKENIVVQLLQKTHDVKHVSELLDMPIEAIERIAQNNKLHI
ncbi:MAG: Rpn family recombination-promoting nuclease/putative transposase, partial [Eubacteriales bacterium]|nr:Rpn family recombination-promoting nuclease/putative transposase [Eubacteriales bacterium]